MSSNSVMYFSCFATNLLSTLFSLIYQCSAYSILTLYKCLCSFVLPFQSFTFMDVVNLDTWHSPWHFQGQVSQGCRVRPFKMEWMHSFHPHYTRFLFYLATPLEASILFLGFYCCRPPSQPHFLFQVYIFFFEGEGDFFRGDFFWEGCSILPQNSYKSSRDL